MTLDDLRREFEEQTIGPEIWGLVVSLSRSVARRYPSEIYNAGEAWSEASIEDLSQDVVVGCLLEDGQLRYLFDVADGIESFRRLMVRQVKRALYRRRSATVVDRLLSRVKKISSTEPFQIELIGHERWLTLKDYPASFRSLDERGLRLAAAAVVDVPRLAESTASGRASMVYTTPDLIELVESVIRLVNGVTESDLAKIIEIVLTAWLPTFLEETEESQALSTGGADSDLDHLDLMEAVHAFTATLDDTDRVVLLYKSQNLADAAVASRIGRSRPWVADRKRQVLARVETELMRDIHPDSHGLAATLLLRDVSVKVEESADANS